MKKERTSYLENWPPERLLAFSDGVFAIAVTLLVLGIDIPEGEHIGAGKLNEFFISLEPFLIAYTTSFLLVCVYWVQHHFMFKYVKQVNHSLIWLNLVLLLVVCLVPFVSKLKSLYRLDVEVIAIFAGIHLISGLLIYVIWRYIYKHPEILSEDIEPDMISWASRRILFTPVICVLAVLISILNPWVGNYIFLLIPLYLVLNVVSKKTANSA